MKCPPDSIYGFAPPGPIGALAVVMLVVLAKSSRANAFMCVDEVVVFLIGIERICSEFAAMGLISLTYGELFAGRDPLLAHCFLCGAASHGRCR